MLVLKDRLTGNAGSQAISPSGALSNFKSTLLSVDGKTQSLSSTGVQLIFLKAPKSPAYSIP
jgi:hypothetical protein